jgi:hypothetical protein
MLEQLTPDQRFELCAYHGMEPFGEVRMDFRFAQVLSTFTRFNSKKGTKVPPLAAFTLFPDLAEAAEERQGSAALMSELSRFAEKSSG